MVYKILKDDYLDDTNDQTLDDSSVQEHTLEDEIHSIEEQLNSVQTNNINLWDNVVVPYINNSSSQVLNKLKDCYLDRKLFCNFMLNNNPSYIKLLKYYRSLIKQSEHKGQNRMTRQVYRRSQQDIQLDSTRTN